MQQTPPKALAGGQGAQGWLGGLGVRFMIPGADSGGGFALVEHPLKPRALAAPLHRHSREDEFSYVLRGRVGALLGEHVVFGDAGDLIYKPRGQWHTFWNAGDEDASLLEIISPAGFEKYFGAAAARQDRTDCCSLWPRARSFQHPRALRRARAHLRIGSSVTGSERCPES